MIVSCPACRTEWTIADVVNSTATCPACGQNVSTGTQTPAIFLDDDTPAAGETQEWIKRRPSFLLDIPHLPVRMGRYYIESLIAEGGFAKVYLATDEELGRKVALKIPRPKKFSNIEMLNQFLTEARTAAKLRHPGIVTIFDVGQLTEGLHFIAMEYVAGQCLSESVNGERLTWRAGVELLTKVCDAVHEAHRSGLVHRDIKPSNILIDERGEPPLVVDFGLAVHEDSLASLEGQLAGTPVFMSPEQIRGDVHHLDGRTDIWSIGCVFYQLLTGRLPFKADLKRIRDEILNRPPRPPRQIDDRIPRELETICLKCLSKSIDNRYTTAKDLADELRHWLSLQAPETPHKRTQVSPSPKIHEVDRRIASHLRGWPLVMLLLIGFGSLGLLAANLPLNPKAENPPEKVAKQPVARPQNAIVVDSANRVDLTAKPFVWLPLVDRIPKLLVWGGETATDRWEYIADRQEILVDAKDIMMAELGETCAQDFKVQMTIIKNSWSGSAGLFWGYVPKNGGGHVCQSLFAYFYHKNSTPVLNIRREMMELTRISDGMPRPPVNSVRIVSTNLPVVEHGEYTLEVRIKQTQVVSVRWMGEEIDAVHDSPATIEKIIPTACGQFGIFNSFGTTRFRDVRFQLSEPE